MSIREWAYEAFYNERSKLFVIVNDIIAVIIILSCIFIALETIPSLYSEYSTFFFSFEVFIFIAFSLEYSLRVYGASNWKKYVFSVFGVIDLAATISSGLFILGVTEAIIAFSFRLIRAIRVIRVLKFVRVFGGKTEVEWFREKDIYDIEILLAFLLLSSYILGTLLYFSEYTTGYVKSIPDGIVKVLFLMFGYDSEEIAANITTFWGTVVGFTARILGYIVAGMIIAIVLSVFSRILLGEEMQHSGGMG